MGFVHRTNLTLAKAQADANALYFNRPYYVVTSTAGLFVERDPPSDLNKDRIVYTARPPEVLKVQP